MKAQTQNVSVWHRPISRRTIAILVGFIAVAMIVVFAYPYAVGTLTWMKHQTVSYRGSSVPLPFGWIEDEVPGVTDGFDVERPSWHSIPTLLMARHHNMPEQNAQRYRASWIQMHSHARITGTVADDSTKREANDLICAELDGAQNVAQDCLSDSSHWDFSYSGTAADMRDANRIMGHVLSLEKKAVPENRP